MTYYEFVKRYPDAIGIKPPHTPPTPTMAQMIAELEAKDTLPARDKEVYAAIAEGYAQGKTPAPTVRQFGTGATRSSDAGRYDPEGFLSPLVIERFSVYMNKHRVQADGGIRDSDNWQKGMPRDSYIKGMWRHFLHFWQRHRGWLVTDPGAAANIEEDLCAILFNAQGYLHSILAERASMVPLRTSSEEAGQCTRS